MTRLATCFLALLCLAYAGLPAGGLPKVRGQSPAAAVEAAARDLAAVKGSHRPYRYFSAYWLDPNDEADARALERIDQALRFWAPSLGRRARLAVPLRVTPTLWRVCLDDYKWDPKVWERLGQAEPWFTVQTVKVTPGKPGAVGRYVWKPVPGRPGVSEQAWEPARAAEPDRKETTPAAAPWVPLREAVYLQEQTGSLVPVVAADWWVFQTGQQRDRVAGYYDWLGLGKKRADFLALGDADLDRSEKLEKLRRAAVKRSEVVHNARGVEAAGTRTEGVVFVTRDYDATVKEKNALRLLERDAKPAGGEGYITTPVGAFAFWVENGDEERLDTVPDNVAGDKKGRGSRTAVEVGISCVRCHVEGLRPINNWVAVTYRAPNRLEGAFAEDTYRLQAAYLSDMEKLVDRGTAVYADFLKRANGLAPAENAKVFTRVFEDYEWGNWTPAEFAARLGVKGKALNQALTAESEALEKAGGRLDPILTDVRDGGAVRVEHAEELIPLSQEILARHRGALK